MVTKARYRERITVAAHEKQMAELQRSLLSRLGSEKKRADELEARALVAEARAEIAAAAAADAFETLDRIRELLGDGLK
jgi:hypothetical protein